MSLQDRLRCQLAGCGRLLFALGGSLLLAACGVSTLSIPAVPSTPGPGSVPYHLLSFEPAETAEATQHRQVVGFVRAALAARGMHEVGREAAADVVVTLEYEVGRPQNGPVSETEAVFEITPGKMVDQSVAVGIGATGNTLYEMRKVKEPDIKIYQGERPITVIRTVYEKRLRLSARAENHGPGDRPGREIWSLELIAGGRSRDFKKILPVLAGQGRPYLGPEAEGATILRLDDDTGAIESVDRTL